MINHSLKGIYWKSNNIIAWFKTRATICGQAHSMAARPAVAIRTFAAPRHPVHLPKADDGADLQDETIMESGCGCRFAA